MSIIKEAKEVISNYSHTPDYMRGNEKAWIDIMSRLVDVAEQQAAQKKKLESLCLKAEMGMADIFAYDIRDILNTPLPPVGDK